VFSSPLTYAILAVFISGLSAYFAYRANQISSKLSTQHIDPEIKIFLQKINVKPIEYVISNTGDIPIVSISILRSEYRYEKDIDAVTLKGSSGKIYYPYSNFFKKLDVNEHQLIEVGQYIGNQSNVLIQKINIKYYRENDMKLYNNSELFFIENGHIYNHKEYKKRSNYQTIMKSIMEFDKIEF
jgi:hypothetical protein